MSRTRHHGEKALVRKFDQHYRTFKWGAWWEGLTGNTDPTPPKRKRSTQEWWPMRTTPSWWTREMMTRPHRARTRQWINRAMKLHDLDDAPCVLHEKRPHIYYW